MKIKNNLVPLAYELSKKHFEKKITFKEAKDKLSANGQMNENSAADYINNFKCMLEGRKFTRTLNAFSMDYFMEKIFSDYGKPKLSNALDALRLHIEYYENQQNTVMHLNRNLVNTYDNLLNQDLDLRYTLSKKIYEDEMTLEVARQEFKTQFPKKSNFDFYPRYFRKLITGEKFGSQINRSHLDYFIRRIISDYGEKGLFTIIKSLKLSTGKAKYFQTLLQKYIYQLPIEKFDDWEEREFFDSISKTKKTKEEIYNELITTEELPEIKILNTFRTYRRNNANISKIKFLRPPSCQICGSYVLKKNGDRYIEAAHIVPKSKNGSETWKNIILLCPNHHKEFDLGDTKEISFNNNILKFTMNGEPHTIDLNPNFD